MKRKRKKRNAAIVNPIPNKQKEPIKAKKKWGVKVWSFVGAVALIAGIFGGWPEIKKWFKSPKEDYEDEYFAQGDLKPSQLPDGLSKSGEYSLSEAGLLFTEDDSTLKAPPIKGVYFDVKSNEPFVLVVIGNNCFYCMINDFNKGVNILKPTFSGCTNTQLTLGVKDKRLYVSTEFKDLQKEETIGYIEFNHWKLYKPNMLTFTNDDERLEVKDKQNNIAFSIKFARWGETPGVPVIRISGYYITPSSVFIMPNTRGSSKIWKENKCIYKNKANWKEQAQEYIVNYVQSIFN